MNDLMIFENPEFGKIRSVHLDGEAWLVGKDVAEELGYTNPRKALADHVDEEDKRQGDGVTIRDPMGREQTPTVINESGLYSLVLSSKLPGAKRFRRWVTSEVLPTLRRQGTYTMQTPKTAMELLHLQSRAMFELDERVSVLENQMTIDHGQQRELQKAVSRRVLDRAATVIPAWALDEQKPKFFASLYRDLKDRFGVPSYRDIRPADYPSAMAYVETWIEPAELRRKEG